MRLSATDDLARILPDVADTVWHNRSALPINTRFQGMTVAEVPEQASERVRLQVGRLAKAFITRATSLLERCSARIPAPHATKPTRIGVIAVCIEVAAADDRPAA